MARKIRNASKDTKVGQVLTRMRQGESLKHASRVIGIDPRTVERVAGSALRHSSTSGRYVARASDTLQREVRIPSSEGLTDVMVKDSKEASLVGEYWNEVHAYLAKGDASGLARFAKRHVTDANGERVPFLVDRESLDELGNAGVLSFESIYARGV
jgi:hypothetical protein